MQRASSGISSGKARDSNAARGTQTDPSMNSYFDGENDEPLRFWGIAPYFQRNPRIAICVRCGFNRGSGSLTQAAAAAATKKATMGCWISTGFRLGPWVVSNWTLPSSAMGTFKDVGHWTGTHLEASRFTFMGMGRKK